MKRKSEPQASTESGNGDDRRLQKKVPRGQAPISNNERMHPRSMHRDGLDYFDLGQRFPEFNKYVYVNRFGGASIDHGDPDALRALTRALLLHCYQLRWEIPSGYLSPPVPSRANYIHYVADLISGTDSEAGDASDVTLLKGPDVRGVDIGIGANCIYSLLGARLYGWRMVGTEVDAAALELAKANVDRNDDMRPLVDVRLQTDASHIFQGVLNDDERFAFSVCNPPFHDTIDKAHVNPQRALDGSHSELVCDGGELGFISRMIAESQERPKQIVWYTSLVARLTTLKEIKRRLAEAGIAARREFTLYQGKQTRWVIAWTFHGEAERQQEIDRLRSPSTQPRQQQQEEAVSADHEQRQEASAADVRQRMADVLAQLGQGGSAGQAAESERAFVSFETFEHDGTAGG